MVVVLRCRQGSNEGVDLIWGSDREEEVAARLTGELDQLSIIAVQIFQADISAEVDGTDPVVRFAPMSHPLSRSDWRIFSEVIPISLVIAFDADDYVTDPGDRRLSGGSG
jgi:hypothetical protein